MTEALQQISEALIRCNKCGFCLAGCPIYKVTGIEWAAARGRLTLLRSVVDNELELSELKEPLFNCLTCNCCVDHCPSGVRVDELIIAARAELVQKQGQPYIQRVIFQRLLSNPSRLQNLIRPLRWLQAIGLRSAARQLGLTGLLGNIGKAEPILPPLPGHYITSLSSPKLEHPEYRVAYFVGCAGINLNPQVTEAAIRVLNRHNVEVEIPDFACCGMPAHGYGDVESTLTMVKKNIDLAGSLEVDAIITTCATCGSMLKRYPNLVSNDADYSGRANYFAGKVKDISEFLMDIGLVSDMETLRYKVTYHDPCHLGRFQEITNQPRQIIQSIPGVELVGMAEANTCCGAAGSYNIGHHDLSMKVLARKMGNIARTDAELLVTCCPGCSMQLAHGIREHDLKIKSLELVELLDLAYCQASKGK
ncbi:(Fe-S)-binding protein [Chloroflexota bacterium]